MSSPSSPLPHRASVAIVDDDSLARCALGRVFVHCNCSVVLFSTGPEAIAHVAVHDVDVLITDLDMPGMDGTRVAAAVEQRQLTCAVVVISAHSVEHTLSRLRSAAVTAVLDVLQKPVGLAEARALLDSLPRRDAPAR